MGLAGIGLAINAASAIAGGVAASNAAKGEKLRAEINAYVAETRAKQTNTVARANLESELASVRSAFGANDQRMTGANYDLMGEVRRVRNRERRINVGNEMRMAFDQKIAAQNAQARATGALIGGFGRAAGSLFDLIQLV